MVAIKNKIIIKILNSSLVRLRFVVFLGRLVQKLSSSDFVKVEGSKMFVHKNDGLALSLFGTYEPEQTEIVKKFVKEGDNVIDIGAHIGYYTLLLARLVGKSGKVFSFEPDPENFKMLRKNVNVNNFKNVEVFQKAVTNKSGKTKLYINKNRAENTIYVLNGNEKNESVIVESIKLDEFFSRNQKIDFIKIDAEGTELKIIEGMSDILEKSKHIKIIIEFFPYLLVQAKTDPKKLLENLIKKGFKLFEVRQNTGNNPMKIEEILKKANKENKVCINILCIR